MLRRPGPNRSRGAERRRVIRVRRLEAADHADRNWEARGASLKRPVPFGAWVASNTNARSPLVQRFCENFDCSALGGALALVLIENLFSQTKILRSCFDIFVWPDVFEGALQRHLP